MGNETQTDEQLLRSFYGCNKEALMSTSNGQHSLEGCYRAFFFNFALRKFRDRGVGDAYHLAQEACNNLWMKVIATKHKPSTRCKIDESPVKPWLFRILRNEISTLGSK